MRFVFALLALACSMGAGCRLYRPNPLDEAAHHTAWQRRTQASDKLQDFALRLAARGRSVPVPELRVDLADGIEREECELLALVFNPELRAARARAGIQAAQSRHAGTWDNLVLSGDVLHAVENVSDPWVIGGTLGVTVPLSGRLRVARAQAEAAWTAEELRVVELEWAICARLRQAWCEWSAAHWRSELLAELDGPLARIVEMVERLQAAGALTRLEGRLFLMERALRTSELLIARGLEQQKRLEVLALAGLVPDCPVSLAPSLALAPPVLPADRFRALADQSPTLAALRAAYAAAEQALRLEIRKQFPDLTLGPAFESDDTSDRVGLGFSVPLPVWNRNSAGIARATAERTAARVDYETAHERLLGQLAQVAAQHGTARAVRTAIEETLLPLAEAQLTDDRQRAELGEVEALVTLENLVRSHDIRMRLVDARLAESLAAARLHEVLGPAALSTSPPSAEAVPTVAPLPEAESPSTSDPAFDRKETP